MSQLNYFWALEIPQIIQKVQIEQRKNRGKAATMISFQLIVPNYKEAQPRIKRKNP